MYFNLSSKNFRHFLAIMLAFFSTVQLNAQATNPFTELTSKSPTKTLLDQGRLLSMPNSGVDMRRHNGIIDDTNTTDDYIYEHLELVRSCKPTIAPEYRSYYEFDDQIQNVIWADPEWTGYSYADPVALYDGIISVTDWDYNTINPVALDSGWVYMDPNDSIYKLRTSDYQIIDSIVTDSALFYSTSPPDPNSYYIDTASILIDSVQTHNTAFETHRYLALGISESVFYLSATNSIVRLVLPDEFIFKNPNRQLYLDFGNGQAPVLAEADEVYEINYPIDGTYVVRVMEDPECDLLEETCIKSTFKIKIAFGISPSNQFIVGPARIENPCELDYSLDRDLKEFGGGESFGTAVVSTWLRNINPDSEGRITRPVIILDGFNSFEASDEIHDRMRSSSSAGIVYGKIHAGSIGSGEFEPNGSRALERFPKFIDSVRSADYDFVFVDWHTNRTSIQANANAFKEILQQINAEMQEAGSTEEIVVIGPSMGGQIARVAIREMEMADCCHNVRLYVSFDSPHRGANIPLSLQRTVEALATHFDLDIGINGLFGFSILPSARDARETFEWVIKSPAARQMLVEHISGNSASQTYFDYVNSIGFPKLPELIAISNGSYQGVMQGDRQFIDPSDNAKVALTQTAMIPGNRYLTLRANLPAYTTVPTNPALLLDYFTRATHYNNDFSLMYAEPYVTIADPSGSLNQLLMERGLSFNTNFNTYLTYLYVVGKWNYLFYQNAAFHYSLIAGSSACLPCLVALAISWVVSAAVISGTGTGILTPLVALNQALNYNVSLDDIYHDNVTLAWDHLPGSFITTPMGIKEPAEDMVDLVYPRHTFMPTVSTLALMGTDDFSIDISSITDPELLASTPFSSVYFNYSTFPESGAMSHNQEHVEVTLHMVEWLMNQIRKSERIPDAHLNAQGDWDLSSRYNFGSPQLLMNQDPSQNISLQYIPSVNVVTGGSLKVNSSEPLGFSGFASPKKAHYKISASGIGCDASSSIVNIATGGQLVIGDLGDIDHSADVFFPSGSQLILSGTLKINNSSRLIIEEGAEIIMNPGASIELDGPFSELVIQGKLVMNLNAHFAPQGPGLVRFDQEGMSYGNSTNFIQVAGNNEFRISGNDSSLVHLIIDETTFLTQSWDSVVLSGAKILIAGDEYFDARAKLRAQGVSIHLNSDNPGTGYHSGFRFYGFMPTVFENNTVQNGKFGIYANALVGTDNTKYISGSRFLNNKEGVSTRGGSFHFTDCEFVDNTIGLRLKDFSSNSTVQRNSFENNEKGIYANSPSNQSLNVSTSLFTGNAIGLYAEEITAYLECSEWNGETVAVLSDFAKINLSNDALCDFINNDTVVKLHSSQELYLKSGFNSFSGNSRIIEGDFYFASGSGNLATTNGLNYTLDMKDNYPNQTLNYSMFANISGFDYFVQLQNMAYSSVLNVCSDTKGPNLGSNKKGLVHTSASNLKVLNSLSSYNAQQLVAGPFSGITVGGAIESLFTADSIEELATVDSLFMIVDNMHIVNSLDATVYVNVMSTAVKVLMTYANNTASQLMANAYNSLTIYANNSNGQSAALVYHLLSSIERYQKNYTAAISLNQSALGMTVSVQLYNQLLYWSCILPLESDLYNRIIDFDTYETQELYCRQMYISNKREADKGKAAKLASINQRGVLVYPNPTSGCSVVRPKEIESFTIFVRDVSGLTLKTFHLNNEHDHEYLCTESYAPGIYILSVYDENSNFVQSIRWLVTR